VAHILLPILGALTVDSQPLMPSTTGGFPTATISPPAPWTVSGPITAAAKTKPVLAMAYQVADGPVNSFPVPPDAANPANTPQATTFSFPLTSSDISANGTYPVTIFAWDSDGASQAHFNVQAVDLTPNDALQVGGQPSPAPGGTP
jgi:hypothetical protein